MVGYASRQARSRAAWAATGGAIPAPAYAHNFSAANLARYRAKREATIAGSGYTKVACWGDSKTRGYGAGNGSGSAQQQGGVNAQVGSYPYQLAQALPANLKAICETIGADGVPLDFNNDGSTTVQDTALMYGNVAFAGTANRNGTSLGGALLTLNAVGDTMTVTPRVAVDRFDIYTQRSGTGGTITVGDEDTAVLATINTNGASASGFIKTTVTRPAASTKPIVITCTVAGLCQVGIVDPYRDSVKSTRIANFGAIGTTSTNQASNASSSFSPRAALKTFAPDLTLIEIGTNDMGQSIPAATYKTNLDGMVADAQVSGDVVLIWPSAEPGLSPAARAPYRQAMLEVAQARGCVMVDFSELMVAIGGRLASNADGPNAASLFFDSLHEAKPGYLAEAQALVPLLTA